MNKHLAVLVLGLSLFAANLRAGQNVGNGGDAITCRASTQNFLNGTYSLDYILTLQSPTADIDTVQVTSWNQSAERISLLLAQKLPSLAPYFEEYRKSVFNTNFTRRYIWETAPFGLMDLRDENIKSQLPTNCKSGSDAQIAQAVIRQFASHSGSVDHVIYKYMPSVVQELERNNPLQLSYLLVHEWLWDFSSNVERNRRFNRLLHSPRFELTPAAELKDLLRGMGFSLPEIQPDIFQASSCDGNRLTLQDINERYRSENFTANLGAMEIVGRKRVLHCSAEDLNCSKTWNPNTTHVFQNFRFFGAVSRTWTGEQSPLKIVSPDLFRSEGSRYTPGMSHLSCKFINTPDANIECSIASYSVVSALTGILGEPDMDRLPKFRGMLTDECMRLDTSYVESIPTFGPAGHSRLVFETQRVFFLRHRWNQ